MNLLKREKRVDLWNKYNLKIMALEDKGENPNAFNLSLESKEVDEKGKNLLTFICHDKTFKSKVEKNE